MWSDRFPAIGLPCGKVISKAGVQSYDIKQAYIDSLIEAGALPIIIPTCFSTEKIGLFLDTLDGFLLSGGADVAPEIFGGLPHPRIYGIDMQRDNFEIYLVKQLIERRIPLLAICRGTQVFNVAMGGTLFTDIASQLPAAKRHDWFPGYPRDRIAHQVELKPGSQLSTLINATHIPVNSLHHQSIKDLGKGLSITASAPDGIVEGVEYSQNPFAIGVQWHPECIPQEESSKKIFSSFVAACHTYHTVRKC